MEDQLSVEMVAASFISFSHKNNFITFRNKTFLQKSQSEDLKSRKLKRQFKSPPNAQSTSKPSVVSPSQLSSALPSKIPKINLSQESLNTSVTPVAPILFAERVKNAYKEDPNSILGQKYRKRLDYGIQQRFLMKQAYEEDPDSYLGQRFNKAKEQRSLKRKIPEQMERKNKVARERRLKLLEEFERDPNSIDGKKYVETRANARKRSEIFFAKRSTAKASSTIAKDPSCSKSTAKASSTIAKGPSRPRSTAKASSTIAKDSSPKNLLDIDSTALNDIFKLSVDQLKEMLKSHLNWNVQQQEISQPQFEQYKAKIPNFITFKDHLRIAVIGFITGKPGSFGPAIYRNGHLYSRSCRSLNYPSFAFVNESNVLVHGLLHRSMIYLNYGPEVYASTCKGIRKAKMSKYHSSHTCHQPPCSHFLHIIYEKASTNLGERVDCKLEELCSFSHAPVCNFQGSDPDLHDLKENPCRFFSLPQILEYSFNYFEPLRLDVEECKKNIKEKALKTLQKYGADESGTAEMIEELENRKASILKDICAIKTYVLQKDL
jgi:hypothetical protein